MVAAVSKLTEWKARMIGNPKLHQAHTALADVGFVVHVTRGSFSTQDVYGKL